ncbi:Gtr1/RagA G protein conserved region-domain-containing protein [Pisolithus marmoratus]|nr:Gtr1/RagA G protein conserved region-domain-containing protein [Pisolithus marmoratus]
MTSLSGVARHLPPKQTFYLEPTTRVTRHTFDTIIPLEIWDCPGDISVDSLGSPLSDFSTVVFVIDIRDRYQQPVAKLVEFVVAAFQTNPNVDFEVLVHKAEKLQEDDKYENFRQIQERVIDRLVDEWPEFEQVPLNFHLTSVTHPCPKAFLFDIASKLYVATDASPVDQATHNLCCDYLQMLNSFGPLYKSNATPNPRTAVFSPTQATSSDPPSSASSSSPPSLPPKPIMRRGLEGVREIWEVEKERSEADPITS